MTIFPLGSHEQRGDDHRALAHTFNKALDDARDTRGGGQITQAWAGEFYLLQADGTRTPFLTSTISVRSMDRDNVRIVYWSDQSVVPPSSFGWIRCTETREHRVGQFISVDTYTRYLEIHDEASELDRELDRWVMPVDAPDVHPTGRTKCSTAFFLAVSWYQRCVSIGPFPVCIMAPLIDINPRFGNYDEIELGESPPGRDIITANADIWVVDKDGVNPRNGFLDLQAAARIFDFYGYPGEMPITNNRRFTNVFTSTIDRIWGQCGIQFRLPDTWGYGAPPENLHRMPVVSITQIPDGLINTARSNTFLQAASATRYFNSNAFNFYFFPEPLGGSCRTGGAYGMQGAYLWGTTYPRGNWYVQPADLGSWDYGADVFMNNTMDCFLSTGIIDWDTIVQRISRTAAHEIGHALLQDGGHPACFVEPGIFPDNLMTAADACPGEDEAGTGDILTGTQCDVARSFLLSHPNFLVE